MTGATDPHMNQSVVEGHGAMETEVKGHGVVVHPDHIQTKSNGSSSHHTKPDNEGSTSVLRRLVTSIFHTAGIVGHYSISRLDWEN